MGNGNTNNNNKSNTNNVRAVRDFWQIDLFHQPIPLSDFYLAYEDCRKSKRNTINAIAFELDYEANLQQLYYDVNSARYKPRKSIAFIIKQPVMREVFAADFRDRIIHHLLISKLNPLFEKSFIYDSYACRVGKGTHFGISRVAKFIRSCSRNYTQDCYILKLDISAFFMSIDRSLLWERLSDFVDTNYRGADIEAIKYLLQITVEADPTKSCIIKGSPKDWDGLPPAKSLFNAPKGFGLPIGNLTSQVFANFYMTPFDHYMKHDLGLRYYGRYVDDFIIVHRDKEYLKSLLPLIRSFLKEELKLNLHPRKISLQHYSKGLKFLGCVIKPYRTYIANRTKGNLYNAIEKYNALAKEVARADYRKLAQQCMASLNSYLGIMSHYASYAIRRKEIYKHLSPWWSSKLQPRNYCRKLSRC